MHASSPPSDFMNNEWQKKTRQVVVMTREMVFIAHFAHFHQNVDNVLTVLRYEHSHEFTNKTWIHKKTDSAEKRILKLTMNSFSLILSVCIPVNFFSHKKKFDRNVNLKRMFEYLHEKACCLLFIFAKNIV